MEDVISRRRVEEAKPLWTPHDPIPGGLGDCAEVAIVPPDIRGELFPGEPAGARERADQFSHVGLDGVLGHELQLIRGWQVHGVGSIRVGIVARGLKSGNRSGGPPADGAIAVHIREGPHLVESVARFLPPDLQACIQGHAIAEEWGVLLNHSGWGSPHVRVVGKIVNGAGPEAFGEDQPRVAFDVINVKDEAFGMLGDRVEEAFPRLGNLPHLGIEVSRLRDRPENGEDSIEVGIVEGLGGLPSA